MNHPSLCIVKTTIPANFNPKPLIHQCIQHKQAICVQQLPGITSHYPWGGAIQTDTEHILLFKTLDTHVDALIEYISTHHPYDIPEIITLNPSAVSDDYLAWARGILS